MAKTDNDLTRDGGLNIDDATRFAGVSRVKLYGEMAAGRLAFAQIGRRRVILKASLQQWLRNHLARPCGSDD